MGPGARRGRGRGGDASTEPTPEPTPEHADELEAELEESLTRVERGGIPLAAERRLSELRERGGLFTSDLSVNGFALCHQLGLKPLSQVMGSSIYQVGYQASMWPMGGAFLMELDTLSEAWNEVRGRALHRLAEEARHAGADAVVGVQLRTDEHDWALGAIEYVVVGTAVRREAARESQHPVLTELSVSDYSKLIRAGIEPLGVVAWSSVFFVSYAFNMVLGGSLGGGMLNPVQNYELREFTQALYSAREQVMQNLSYQAQSLDASGIVGVRIRHEMHRHSLGGAGAGQREGLMVTFHAIGTAIRETAAGTIYPPEATVDLTT